MAINITNGFSTFNTFVQFAEHRNAAGLKGDVAKATLSLDKRAISTVTVGSAATTSASWFSRTGNDKIDNDRTREIFRAAIAKMFGGESKIPASVVKAMEMENYGHGRPLTARRILLVKAAIDKTDAPRRAAELQFRATGQKVFERLQPETKAALVGKGYTKAELPNIARAVKAYAKSQGVSEADALREVTTAGTKANRLASYGGRFLASSANFADGLRLLDSFEGWYADLKAFKDSHSLGNAEGDTPTKLHIDGAATSNNGLRGLEAMVFQHIAVDRSIDLKKDGEEVFGMANNAAMRFFGRNMHESVLGSVLNVPPAKRGVLFAAVDVFQPLFRDGAAVAANQGRPASEWRISKGALFVSRCIAHLDELSDLQSKGQLTAKNILKICFPDIPKGRADLRTLNEGCEAILDTLNEEVGMQNQDGAWLKMLATGCSLDEVLRFYQDGTQPPARGKMTDWTMPLSDYEGGGFAQMRADLPRNYNYFRMEGGLPDKSPAGQLVPADQANNNIAFPDGTRLACSSKPEHKDNVGQVEAKIKSLCGEAHGFQAEVVAFCLSQSGKAPIRHALKEQGIFNAEHAVADISLSKDAITGAVTIHYTSPASLPVRFSWNTTVNTDGTTVTTPLRIEKPIREMTLEQATKMVKEAADKYNYDLPRDEIAQCASLLAQNATGLLPRYAKVLAQFIVKLPFDPANAERSRLKAAETAGNLRTARSFAFGDPRVKDIEDALKANHNAYIAGQMAKNQFGTLGQAGSENIFGGMTADLGRVHTTINGQTFAKDVDTDIQAIYTVFKEALPAEKAQKAVSCVMHQGSFGDLSATMSKTPIAGENDMEPFEMFNLPGAKLLFQRDMNDEDGLYSRPAFDSNQSPNYDLQVSPDGNTAVVTMRMKSPLMMGNLDNEDESFGTIQLTQKLTLDLRPDVPVVTDVKLSQIITE
jgi:hypothetical protein